MLITITKNEIANLNNTCRAEFETLTELFGIKLDDLVMQEVALQGVTVTDQGDRWVIEISPEVAQRQARAIGRFTRIAAPLVLTLKAAFAELFKELEDIERWIAAKR